MGWFDKFTNWTNGQPLDTPVWTAESDIAASKARMAARPNAASAVEPRDGVHHEYFVNDEAVNGLLAWHCRVYAKDGAPHEMTGSAQSREAASIEAQAWAADKKRELRGIA